MPAVDHHDGLAAAERQSGHRVLEAHAARHAQRVGQGFGARTVMPETAAARARAALRRMDCDDRAQAGFLVLGEHDTLVRVESGVIEHGLETWWEQNVLHYRQLASGLF